MKIFNFSLKQPFLRRCLPTAPSFILPSSAQLSYRQQRFLASRSYQQQKKEEQLPVPTTLTDDGLLQSFLSVESQSSYVSRLKHLAFSSPIELLHAPYAPAHPSIVLEDVLRRYEEEMQNKNDEEKSCSLPLFSNTPLKASPLTTITVKMLLQPQVESLLEAKQDWLELNTSSAYMRLLQEQDAVRHFGKALFPNSWEDEKSLQMGAKMINEAATAEQGSDAEKKAAETQKGAKKSLRGILQVLADSDGAGEEGSNHLLSPSVKRLHALTIYQAILEQYLDLCRAMDEYLGAIEAFTELQRIGEEMEVLMSCCEGEFLEQRKASSSSSQMEVLEQTLQSFQSITTPEKSFLHPSLFVKVVESCSKSKKFSTALSIFNLAVKLQQQSEEEDGKKERAVAITNKTTTSSSYVNLELARALASCIQSDSELRQFRYLFVEELSHRLPVDEKLYRHIIAACAKVKESPRSSRMQKFALSMYRTLRDEGICPSAETYAALMQVCASAQDTNQAFSFYHEARQVHGREGLPASLYTALILAYIAGGFHADARKTFDVLVETDTLMDRSTFHAAIASSESMSDAFEVLDIMSHRPYNIFPTVATFQALMDVAAWRFASQGENTLLAVYDLHIKAINVYIALDLRQRKGDESNPASEKQAPGDEKLLLLADDGKSTPSSSSSSNYLETARDLANISPKILQNLTEEYPLYIDAMERALLTTSIRHQFSSETSPLKLEKREEKGKLQEEAEKINEALKFHTLAVVRPVQHAMNQFLRMLPQRPTKLPPRALVAVLSPETLLNPQFYVREEHFDSIVIPYSAIVAAKKSIEENSNESDGEGKVMYQRREKTEIEGDKEDEEVVPQLQYFQSQLQRFLSQNKEVIHLMSLQEEMNYSQEMRRFAISLKDSETRGIGVAVCLARGLPDVYPRTNPSPSSMSSHRIYAKMESRLKYLTNDPRLKKFIRENKMISRYVQYYAPDTMPTWQMPTKQTQRAKASSF